MIRQLVTIAGTVGIIAGGVALIAVMGAARPKIENEEPEIAAPSVFFAVAEESAVTLDVRAQGEVRPRTDIVLTAQIAGRVISTSGDFVNGGAFNEDALLLKIEDADYQVAVTSARARLAQAKEALRREEAESELAARDYEELGLGDDPSELTLRQPQLAQARANYNAARADLSAAELNLSRTRVKAPFQGRVRERIAGPGQYVAPGSQLGRIFSTDIAEIRLPLTDNDLAQLGVPIAFVEQDEVPGPEVKLSAVIAGQAHEWIGRIARTDGAIDPATRQISAIAVVDDPYGDGADNGVPLTIGLFVDALIEGRPYPDAIILPRTALHGRDRVFVITQENLLEERTVSIVASNRDTVTISQGISAGERIVSSPLRGAGDGDPVEPLNRETGEAVPVASRADTGIASASTNGGL